MSENLGNLEDDEKELLHFRRIINAFSYYKKHSIRRLLSAENHYYELPSHHKQMIPHFRDNLKAVRVCIEHNYEIIKQIISHTDNMFENKDSTSVQTEGSAAVPASDFDMDKVKSTLKQFVRDWSSEGQDERDLCYKPVLQDIQKLFPDDVCKKEEINILVPGAGLGRLAFEIARLGYSCQGNEFSLFMLFASNFILNKCREVDMLTLYPWVHQYCNNRHLGDQIRPIKFPDVNPSDMPLDANFSMAAGDFLEIYTEPNSWDCVATVFFLDTAHNIIAYVEAIWRILKPGGYWINLGPLLYHFADMPNESSIEITYAELREVIKRFKFEILREEDNKQTGYTQNPKSMLKYQYECVYFVAKKPLASSNGHCEDSPRS